MIVRYNGLNTVSANWQHRRAYQYFIHGLLTLHYQAIRYQGKIIIISSAERFLRREQTKMTEPRLGKLWSGQHAPDLVSTFVVQTNALKFKSVLGRSTVSDSNQNLHASPFTAIQPNVLTKYRKCHVWAGILVITKQNVRSRGS